VFGVGTDKGVIKLFDVRSYAQGPFDAFTVSACCSSAKHDCDSGQLHAGVPLAEECNFTSTQLCILSVA